MEIYIAERKLQFSIKGSGVRQDFCIRIGRPYLVDTDKIDFPAKEGFAGCSITVVGLDETHPDVYGADTVQAVNLASNLEAFLKRIQKKYDIYWPSGEPYFDE